MGNNLAVNSRPAAYVVIAGVVSFSSSFAAFWFYNRMSQAMRLDNLRETDYSVEQLNTVVDILRKEIEELKAMQPLKCEINSQLTEKDNKSTTSKSTKSVRFSKSLSYKSSSDVEYEFQSAWSDNEVSSEEFFDFPENESLWQDKNDSSNHDGVPEEAIELFDKVDNLLEGTSVDHELAFKLLDGYKNEFQFNAEFLWRFAKSCRMVAQATSDSVRQKELSYEAVEYGRKALVADSANAEAHKWFAISLGATSCYVSVSEKIRNGVLFKEHIDKAIQINPRDYLLHHLLGRFSFEVSTLSWIERKVASALFKDMPTGSIEEALSYFLHADKLRTKPWKTNHHYIAKCYIQMGQYLQAMDWIKLALPIEVLTAEDQTSHDDLLSLYSQYKSYR